MTDEEIVKAVNRVNGIGGMTVNERLFATGLLDEFDKIKEKDKAKARRILELINVEQDSINKILK